MALGLSSGLEYRASPESPDTPLTSTALLSVFGAEPTDSGIQVNETKALGLTAYLAANRIVAEATGSVPHKVRERVKGGSVDAPDHWSYALIHDRPNPEMSSMQFFELLQHHAMGWGDAYAEIQWNGDRSRWASLWPLLPDRTRAIRRNGVKLIQTKVLEGGAWQEVFLPAKRVLHVPGFGFNGLSGYSPVQLAKQAIGAGLALDSYASKFFGQGGNLGGVLEHPKSLSSEALKRLMETSPILTGGLSQAHRWAVLEEGMKANPFRVNPEDAQALESRKFTIGEVSRITGVPPHMLADLDRPFQSNVEQMGIAFVMYTLRAWFVRFEQAMNWQLFPERERGQFYVEFIVDGLLRGDYKSRSEGHEIALRSGSTTLNEVRRLEGRSPYPDEVGDAIILQQNQVMIRPDGSVVPLNASPGPATAEPDALPAAKSEARSEHRSIDARRRIHDAFREIVRRDAERIVKGEAGAVRRAIEQVLEGQGRTAFLEWLAQYYGDKTAAFVRETLERSVRTFLVAVAVEALAEVDADIPRARVEAEVGQAFGDSFLDSVTERHMQASRGQLGAIIADPGIREDAELAEALRGRLGEWEEGRPEKIARGTVTRGGGAAAIVAWGLAGVSAIRWQSSGENCPLCEGLNGQVVGINRPFLTAGEVVKGDETTADLKVEGNVGHPPLHGGCDCFVAAG